MSKVARKPSSAQGWEINKIENLKILVIFFWSALDKCVSSKSCAPINGL